ncbi:MAG: UDP-N-acetylmuramoyl-tripeptide--D-alanyl-D-alanine ligase [Elusimicrobia bacterium]|nr:UDP-N-acetylmuramoyl-tripeptide--D-alanyl-D-alanine ligase [Elusimicrobiota bacterium]
MPESVVVGTGMDLNLTWETLARGANGRLVRGSPADRVRALATDSRKAEPGTVFWALAGERYDAHDFLDARLAGACDGWVIQRGKRANDGALPSHVIEVPDTLKALQALSAYHRSRFEIPVAAVAGSNGKTSTKEMLRSICSQAGPVCATQGNLNNQIGHPLSLLELTEAHRYGVFELGESHFGDIEELARLCRPTVGVLTNVGPAHLEFLGNLEGVFRCLSELVTASPADTVFAVNLDDPWLAALETQLGERAITYGRGERAAVQLRDSAAGVVELVVQRHKLTAALKTPGRVHQLNAAAAAAGALAMGLGPEEISKGLSAFSPAPMRFEPRRHESGAWLVVDAYNANPGSMRAGIESFLDAYQNCRRILVLGDMKELGPDTPRFHRELGEWIGGLPVEAVFLAGPDMRAAAEAAAGGIPRLVRHADDPKSWAGELRELLGPDAAAFFKASRAVALENVIEQL